MSETTECWGGQTPHIDPMTRFAKQRTRSIRGGLAASAATIILIVSA
jgi:hypothetical protein